VVLCNILHNICEIIKSIFTLVHANNQPTNFVLLMNIHYIAKQTFSHIFHVYRIVKLIHQMVNITSKHVYVC
jgi:hypothetical protein